ALVAVVALGLVQPGQAFLGFADPAVMTVAAVLVIGRAIELSGIAAAIAQRIIPERAGFTLSLAMLLVVGAFLSAFMNNIAALVITMPIATGIARKAKLTPAATLMPLAFATILGGTTTLIGTPANLIIAGARITALGGKPIASEGDWTSALAARKPGERVEIAFAHLGQERRATMTLAADPTLEVVRTEAIGGTLTPAQAKFRAGWLGGQP
ncbi:hypothetical protein FKL64_24145, partial [Escherichia coli]|nr:hypothetical protein [Escherichia coli]